MDNNEQNGWLVYRGTFPQCDPSQFIMRRNFLLFMFPGLKTLMFSSFFISITCHLWKRLHIIIFVQSYFIEQLIRNFHYNQNQYTLNLCVCISYAIWNDFNFLHIKFQSHIFHTFKSHFSQSSWRHIKWLQVFLYYYYS